MANSCLLLGYYLASSCQCPQWLQIRVMVLVVVILPLKVMILLVEFMMRYFELLQSAD